MTPWRWIAGAAVVLCVPAAYVGFHMGQPVPETDAITFFATQYTNDTDRPATDCSAMPSSRNDVWIEVVCIGPDLTGMIYLVGDRGQAKGTVTIKAPQT